jgi:hypothetical protein
MGATQNLTSHLMNMELPTITFNMTRRLKPFERKGKVGKKRWYEETQVGFSSNLRNSIEATDTTLFTQKTLDKMKSSANYSIPISTTIKLFKYFNLSPSFSYNGKFNTKYLRNQYYSARVGPGDVIQKAGYYTDTVSGINHVYDFSFSAPLTTTLYGMVQFKKSKISAIRHVMSPSVSFGLTPDFGAERWGFYTRDTTNGQLLPNYFGVASPGKSGSLGFSLGNNLEMKVHSKDTAEKFKKIVLLQNLNLGTSYNLAADSFNWAPINISASTTLFKQVSVSYSGGVDLYTRDSAGKAQNITYMKRDGKLGHYNRHSLTLSGSISSETFKKKKKDTQNNTNNQTGAEAANNEIPGQTTGKMPGKNNAQKPKDGKTDADGYSFGMPWSISLNLNYFQDRTQFNVKTQNFDRKNTINLGLNGNITLTPKWKVNGGMNFDFMAPKKLVSTNWSIHRDLHCWEMSFDFSPFGTYKHYSFRINVLSSMFQGMEFKRQQSHIDNLTF